ncbi:tautomerase family protein [Hymenobacter sp. YC55]|uniref:tautomerase family protein n=1 Tax=Hymenobacter sp. YC55 TaxID=3034019 RepID=UPI0023F777EF|nr:tautomerase family protein [Hymenobacter sp. YC55]MDF7815150.1 tautomerase family protein [Hymenobacter sp. YC55]
MPLLYLHCPENTFSAAAKEALADELTTIALATEQLPDTPFVRSTVWLYIHEYPAATVYHGGKSAGTRVISLEVNAFAGGHDNASKQALIQQFTEAFRHHAGLTDADRVPVYILFRDVPESNWGVFGTTITLHDLHHPPAGAAVI